MRAPSPVTLRPGRLGSLLLAAVLVAACGGDGGGDAPEPVEITVTVTETGVDAPQRPRVPLGAVVAIDISSYADNDAHLHGYDLWVTVGPGNDGSIEFTADQPGIFLLEMERDLLYLTELVVQ